MKLRITSAFSILGLAATAYAQPYSIATFAGVGTTGDGHPASQSVLTYPQGLAAGPDGSIYKKLGSNLGEYEWLKLEKMRKPRADGNWLASHGIS